jgi:hypothetical protein
MTAWEYLRSIPWLPQSREGSRTGKPSNSETKRWLEQKAVVINGDRPGPYDEIPECIVQLEFFPSGRKVTMA